MHNYIAIIFDDTSKAYEGLHELWRLDGQGEITVHGTAVVHRNDWGQFRVDTKETHPALATAVGVGIGALLGAFAGPAGAAMGAAGGAAVGAAMGGALGVTADVLRLEDREQVLAETEFALRRGQSAVIADVSEDSAVFTDARMRELGGVVSRRDRDTLLGDAWFNQYTPGLHLYPYEYVPPMYAL